MMCQDFSCYLLRVFLCIPILTFCKLYWEVPLHFFTCSQITQTYIFCGQINSAFRYAFNNFLLIHSMVLLSLVYFKYSPKNQNSLWNIHSEWHSNPVSFYHYCHTKHKAGFIYETLPAVEAALVYNVYVSTDQLYLVSSLPVLFRIHRFAPQ